MHRLRSVLLHNGDRLRNIPHLTYNITMIGIDKNCKKCRIAIVERQSREQIVTALSRFVDQVLPPLSELKTRIDLMYSYTISNYVVRVFGFELETINDYYAIVAMRYILTALFRCVRETIRKLKTVTAVVLENLSCIDLNRKIKLVGFLKSKQYIEKLLRSCRLIALLERPPVNMSTNMTYWAIAYLYRDVPLILVDPSYTSRLCHRCLIELDTVNICARSGSVLYCPLHGQIDVDVNASVVLAYLTLKAVENLEWVIIDPGAGQPPHGGPAAPGSLTSASKRNTTLVYNMARFYVKPICLSSGMFSHAA